jgi:hypothetical protein
LWPRFYALSDFFLLEYLVAFKATDIRNGTRETVCRPASKRHYIDCRTAKGMIGVIPAHHEQARLAHRRAIGPAGDEHLPMVVTVKLAAVTVRQNRIWEL